MQERWGDLWAYAEQKQWVAITTNGMVTQAGRAVMGWGVAKEAARRFPGLPVALANQLRVYGNHVHIFSDVRLLTFPVKDSWREAASWELIQRSAGELVEMVDKWGSITEVYLVRPGCGAGRLEWRQVKPLLAPVLDDRFIVVEPPR